MIIDIQFSYTTPPMCSGRFSSDGMRIPVRWRNAASSFAALRRLAIF
jgi:hypothetical protein